MTRASRQRSTRSKRIVRFIIQSKASLPYFLPTNPLLQHTSPTCFDNNHQLLSSTSQFQHSAFNAVDASTCGFDDRDRDAVAPPRLYIKKKVGKSVVVSPQFVVVRCCGREYAKTRNSFLRRTCSYYRKHAEMVSLPRSESPARRAHCNCPCRSLPVEGFLQRRFMKDDHVYPQ